MCTRDIYVVRTHKCTQMHRHPYTYKYPYIHIPWNKKDNNWFCGHPLVSGLIEDLTLGQHYLRESLEEWLYWVQDEWESSRRSSTIPSTCNSLLRLLRTEEPVLMSYSCSREGVLLTNPWGSLSGSGKQTLRKRSPCRKFLEYNSRDPHLWRSEGKGIG